MFGILDTYTHEQLDPSCPVDWRHPLNQGRTGWWLDTGVTGWRGGKTLRDLVRGGGHNPNDGTLSGTTKPVWGGGKGRPGGRGSLLFDGSSSYIIPARDFFTGGPFTMTCWVRSASISQDQVLILQGAAGWIYLRINTSKLGVVVDGTNMDFGATTLLSNVWYRLLMTYNGTSVRGYVNGVLDVGPVARIGAYHTGTSIGSYLNVSSVPTIFTNGNIDDVAIWNRVLSAQEVAADYALSKQGYPGLLNRITPAVYDFGVTLPPQPIATSTPVRLGLSDSTTHEQIDPSCPVDWSHPLNVGKVAWLLDTGTPGWRGGNTLRDLVRGGGRNPHDGTLSFVVTPKPIWSGARGRPGGRGSLLYDGASSYVSVAPVPQVTNGNYTISAWVSYTSLSNGLRITAWANLTSSTPITLLGNGSVTPQKARFLHRDDANAVGQVEGATTISDGRWHHVVGTRNGSAFTLYVDGKVDGTFSFSAGTQTVNTFAVGTSITTGIGSIWNGYSDDITVFNYGLSAQDVAALYALSKQGYPGMLRRLSAAAYLFPIGSTGYPAPPPLTPITGVRPRLWFGLAASLGPAAVGPTVYIIGGFGGVVGGSLAGALSPYVYSVQGGTLIGSAGTGGQVAPYSGAGGSLAGSTGAAILSAGVPGLGGILSGSTATPVSNYGVFGQGGAVGGAGDTAAVVYAAAGLGGALAGSASTGPGTVTVGAVGGALAGSGSATADLAVFLAQGGMLGGGHGDAPLLAAVLAQGGVLGGAPASSTDVYVVVGRGGGLAGAPGSAAAPYVVSGQGGALSGSTGASVLTAGPSSGGGVLGGAPALVVQAASTQGTGGGLAGSAATVVANTAAVNIGGQGGVLGGSYAGEAWAAFASGGGGAPVGGPAAANRVTTPAPVGGLLGGAGASALSAYTSGGAGGLLGGASALAAGVILASGRGGAVGGSTAASVFVVVASGVGGVLSGGVTRPTVFAAPAPSGGVIPGSAAYAVIVSAQQARAGLLAGSYADVVFVAASSQDGMFTDPIFVRPFGGIF